MDKKEYERLANVYKIIASQLEKKRTINRYEYYLLGGISLRIASSVIYILFKQKRLTLYEYDMLRNFVNKQQQNLVSPHNKEFILKTYYQFGDVVISDEEKKYIWDKLSSIINEKDIDDVVFSGAVRAYAIEKGLIKTNNNQNNKKKLVKIK